ncbi:MAG: hypothetical protein E7566_00755 [Ruminococcaceae bacterium]|nr:hypothetical protein [Oscillospiraceae bacterium]
MKLFKRLAAVVSLSLIISIIIVPCAVFFANAQSVENNTKNIVNNENIIENRVTQKFVDEKNLSDKQDVETIERAQMFEDAKVEAQKTAEEVKKANEAVSDVHPNASVSTNSKYLLEIANPDDSYIGYSISLTDYDRDILERLVMGEAGGEGFIGCCLVAQAIRDTMISDGYKSVESLRTSMGYYGSLYVTPNEDALNAVKFIFDEGGAAVQHNIVYFYAPAICTSGFHESQEFVVAHNSHRFFDRW